MTPCLCVRRSLLNNSTWHMIEHSSSSSETFQVSRSQDPYWPIFYELGRDLPFLWILGSPLKSKFLHEQICEKTPFWKIVALWGTWCQLYRCPFHGLVFCAPFGCVDFVLFCFVLFWHEHQKRRTRKTQSTKSTTARNSPQVIDLCLVASLDWIISGTLILHMGPGLKCKVNTGFTPGAQRGVEVITSRPTFDYYLIQGSRLKFVMFARR